MSLVGYIKSKNRVVILSIILLFSITCSKLISPNDSGSISIQMSFSDRGNENEIGRNNSVTEFSVEELRIIILGMDPISIAVVPGTTVSRTIDGVPIGNVSITIELWNGDGVRMYKQVKWVDVVAGETASVPEFKSDEWDAENLIITVNDLVSDLDVQCSGVPGDKCIYPPGTQLTISWEISHQVPVNIYLNDSENDGPTLEGGTYTLAEEYSSSQEFTWIVEELWESSDSKWYGYYLKVEHYNSEQGIPYNDRNDQSFNIHRYDECEAIEEDTCDCLGNVEDCAGVCGGTAYFDNCGECVGGDTNKVPCTQDCAGEWGGSLELDICGVCGGVSVSPADCECSDGSDRDCNGLCGGSAIIDLCGVCCGGGTDNQCGSCVGCMDSDADEYYNSIYTIGCDWSNSEEICQSLGWTSLDDGTFLYNQDIVVSSDGCCCFYLSSNNEIVLPNSFGLNSVYPNPFNPILNYKFSIPIPSDVKVVIHDINGREVYHHELGYILAGYYSRSWDAGMYPAGIYIISILADNKVDSKKIVLIK